MLTWLHLHQCSLRLADPVDTEAGLSTADVPLLTLGATHAPIETPPTNPFAAQATPSEIFRATPLVLPPLATAAQPPKNSKGRKPRCREQLADCRQRLDKCMKILRWQSIDGRTFSPQQQKQQQFPHLSFTPNLASTPIPQRIGVNKQVRHVASVNYQTHRVSPVAKPSAAQRRGRKPPNRYTPNAYDGQQQRKRQQQRWK